MVVVSCSNGHRFPVNLEKHRNRADVFCPRCREKVVVRKKFFFSPNPDWEKEKERREWDRFEMKERARTPPSKAPIVHPHIIRARAMAGLLAFSRLIKRREEEKKRVET